MTSQATHTAAALALAAAFLAGCGGGAHAPASGLPFATSGQEQSAPMDRGMCQNSDGIKVMPCRVRFDMQHNAPVHVTVSSGDNDRQAIEERDNCAERNVATITRESNHHYVVAPGTVSGTCIARFTRNRHDQDNDRDRDRGSALTIANAG